MTTKRRVYYQSDGSVGIVNPAPKSRIKGESEGDWLERVYKKAELSNIVDGVETNILVGLPYEDKDLSEFPVDWEINTEKLRGGINQQLRIDLSVETPREKRLKIEKELDIELEKENPDVIKVTKFNRQLLKTI